MAMKLPNFSLEIQIVVKYIPQPTRKASKSTFYFIVGKCTAQDQTIFFDFFKEMKEVGWEKN